ncbi:hypothetical protein LJB84_03040 [Bacteroidales bacterium OttesenSCG-928-J19]|nr:hypothetical protein [Bacteroidales bacterium OttesenSCG-928-J19]
MTDVYDKFIAKLREKMPQKKVLVDYIAKVLSIEKDSAYRRLRGDVAFSFQEVTILARRLNLSLDELTSYDKDFKSRPYYYSSIDYIHPEEDDYRMLEVYLNFFQAIKDDPNTEMGATCKIIPDAFKGNYPYINRFYLFKQVAQYGEGNDYPHFKDIVMPTQMEKLVSNLMGSYRLVKNASYIMDKQMFCNIVHETRYFAELKLIDKEDILALKKELLDILDYLEGIAAKGHNELGNKVNFYVSDINFDNDFFYILSSIHSFNLLRAFTLNDIISTDSVSMQKFRQCVQSLKRKSVLISESGEITRIKTFNEQRDYVNAL